MPRRSGSASTIIASRAESRTNAPRLLVEVRAGDVDDGMIAAERLCHQLADDAFAKAGEQHQMP